MRETEIQTIQKKVRILNTVGHGTHFSRIHVVFLLQKVSVFFLFFFWQPDKLGREADSQAVQKKVWYLCEYTQIYSSILKCR